MTVASRIQARNTLVSRFGRHRLGVLTDDLRYGRARVVAHQQDAGYLEIGIGVLADGLDGGRQIGDAVQGIGIGLSGYDYPGGRRERVHRERVERRRRVEDREVIAIGDRPPSALRKR